MTTRRRATTGLPALLVAATGLAGCAGPAACAPVAVSHVVTVRAASPLPSGATMQLGCETEGGCWAVDPRDERDDPTVRYVGVAAEHRPRDVVVRVVRADGTVLSAHEARLPWVGEPMGCGTRWTAETTIEPGA